MIAVHAIADTGTDWYPKNAMETFRRHSRLSFVDTPAAADLIWIFSYYLPLDAIAARPWTARFTGSGAIRRRRGLTGAPIIGTVHHLVPKKESDFLPRIRRLDAVCDAIHFFSRINVEECRRYFSTPILLLPYWIDLNRFRRQGPDARAAVRSRWGIPGDRVVLGSFQRDTEADMVTPKLEKGPDVFCDVVERLDPAKVFVLLAGERRHYVERRLAAARVPFRNVGKVPHGEIAGLYGCLDFYLVTSRYEGGPQAILECMATGTPIYSTPVGIADELESEVICADTDRFVAALSRPYPPVLDAHAERVRAFDAGAVVNAFERAFRQLVEGHRASSGDLCRAAPGLTWAQ